MKISPISSTQTVAPGVDPQAQRIESVRSLKMQTNATPGLPAAPIEAAPELLEEKKEDELETPAAVEATEPLSPQFAALAKQRRALQQERRAFEDERKAFEAKSQGSDLIPKSRIQQETLKVLEESGVTYDMLTEAILNGQGNSELNALKSEIKALKEGVDKRFTEQNTQAEQQVLSEMKREAERLIEGNDDFELVKATESIPDVMKLIERTYRETGEVLDVNDALKLVEDELFNRNQKLLGLKKMQGLFNKQAAPIPAQPERAPGIRTLTNQLTASIPMSRRERALAAAYGTLKK